MGFSGQDNHALLLSFVFPHPFSMVSFASTPSEILCSLLVCLTSWSRGISFLEPGVGGGTIPSSLSRPFMHPISYFFCFVSRRDMSVYDGFSFHRVLCIHDQNTCIVTPTFENASFAT